MSECIRIRHFHSFEGPLHKPDFEEQAGTLLCFFARKAFGKEVIMKPPNQFTIKVIETTHKILTGIVAVFFFELAIIGYLLLEQSKSHRRAYDAYMGRSLQQTTPIVKDEGSVPSKQYTRIEKAKILGAGNIEEIDKVFGVKLKSSTTQDPHRFVTSSQPSNFSIKRQFKDRQEYKPDLKEEQKVPPANHTNIISTDDFKDHIEKMMEKHAGCFSNEEENSSQLSDEWQEEKSESNLENQIKNITSEETLKDKNLNLATISSSESSIQDSQGALFPQFFLSDQDKELIQKRRRLNVDEET